MPLRLPYGDTSQSSPCFVIFWLRPLQAALGVAPYMCWTAWILAAEPAGGRELAGTWPPWFVGLATAYGSGLLACMVFDLASRQSYRQERIPSRRRPLPSIPQSRPPSARRSRRAWRSSPQAGPRCARSRACSLAIRPAAPRDPGALHACHERRDARGRDAEPPAWPSARWPLRSRSRGGAPCARRSRRPTAGARRDRARARAAGVYQAIPKPSAFRMAPFISRGA